MKTKIFFLIFIFLTWGFLWFKGANYFDPDFGWHIKTGQLILEKGIPKTDPFSYTMPSFPFIDHEWLTNVILYKLYSPVNYIFLAGFFSLAAILSLIIPVISYRNDKKLFFSLQLSFGFFLLGIMALFVFQGVRPQVLSWLFFSFLTTILLNKTFWNKFYLFLPILILVWVNLHGSFAVGLATMLVFFVLKYLRTRVFKKKEVFILIVCLAATFINPYRERIWEEIWRTFSDQWLKWRIAEWMPSLFNFHLNFIALVSFSVFLVIKFYKKFTLEELGLFFGFLIQAGLSQRNIPFWIILSLPFLFKCFGFLREQTLKVKYGEQRLGIAEKYLLLGCIFLFVFQLGVYFFAQTSLDENSFYPKEAVLFLKSNLPKGEIFSDYGWGGYLIWNLPEKKVFIDGRMPSWKRKGNFPSESNDAMKDYLNIFTGKEDYKKIFDKYGVSVILWPSTTKKRQIVDMEELFCRIWKCKEKFYFFEEIKNDGWKEIYKDKVATIYSKQ